MKRIVVSRSNKHEGYSTGWAGGLIAAAPASLGSSAGHSGPRTSLGSWHRRRRSADASRARAGTCPPKTKGLVGATRGCSRILVGRGTPCVWDMWVGATPAERHPAGVLDDVLVPLNPGTPGIRPCPTEGAPGCSTHSTKSWRPLLLLLLLSLLARW